MDFQEVQAVLGDHGKPGWMDGETARWYWEYSNGHVIVIFQEGRVVGIESHALEESERLRRWFESSPPLPGPK
jgi:hypothetical protein